MAKILITGGSGLVGKAVSDLLVENGLQVVWLSREEGRYKGITKYKWDPHQHYIDPKAFENVETVIHLAGAGITDRRWTSAYKKEIIDSRVNTSALLFDHITKNNYPVKTLVGAGAVGYYGAKQSDKVYTESDPPGDDFLAEVCTLWEKSYEPFAASGIRTTVLRTAMVLSCNGGAYKKMLSLFKLGLGAAFASGRQYVPWIHIDDLAHIYLNAANDQVMRGIYNAVAPEMVNNRSFSRQLAKSIQEPFFMPDIPAFLLKIAIGESSVAVTEGLQISAEKLKASGFHFRFEHLNSALKDLAQN